jgi:Tfp pilus assembly protein PilN
MLQFNLLPDLKQDYIKANRAKRLVITATFLVAGCSIAIAIVLSTIVYGTQKSHIKNLDDDIKENVTKLQSTPDLNKVLTIQNQLNSLSGLHDQKPVSSRLIGYLTQLVPASCSIDKVSIDYNASTVTFTGATAVLANANKFVDTLKFTKFNSDKAAEGAETTAAFNNVVLSAFSINSGTQDPDKRVDFTVTANFDKSIFDITQSVSLEVPKIVSTRSETEKPTKLFQDAGGDSQETN